MVKLLSSLNLPKALKNLTPNERKKIAQEIRETIVNTVCKNGGHLASGLGSVEIFIAVHTVFDSPHDKIVLDTGHQGYPHKLLTGRYPLFHTLRQIGGISGFPRREESQHDCWGVGHGGTGLSAAMGFAMARKHWLNAGAPADDPKVNYRVVCVVGDAALEEGMALEAIHNIGHHKPDMVIVLNDNGMSIAPSVGAIENYLRRHRQLPADWFRKLRSEPHYLQLKRMVEDALSKMGTAGEVTLEIIRHIKNNIKEWLIPPGMLFEELGFTYLGPVDGHNTEVLIECLQEALRIGGPVIIHAVTKKGKGVPYAEADPWKYHTPLFPFDPQTGEIFAPKETVPSYTSVFSQTLIRMAEQDQRIVAITAAMPDGTGLDKFAKEFPERCYDVGMAEQHAVGFAASLAFSGLRPVCAIYSTFLQRAFDQIIHDVCLQRAPVVFAIDRAGLVGQDGHTHHGIFDIAYLRLMPNMVLMMPKDENELQHMIFTALRYESGPIAVRYPRGKAIGVTMDDELKELPIGKGEWLRDGTDAVIIGIGPIVYAALDSAQKLERDSFSVGVINARFVKPIDKDLIADAVQRAGKLVTVEEHNLSGGFGSAVLEALSDMGLHNVPVLRIGIKDHFVEHGKAEELRAILKLDAKGIYEQVKEWLQKFIGHEGEDKTIESWLQVQANSKR
ncbi:MAG: 1-deoxy-D-xylulose-5-phosphate synthase [Armatimonadetes bacterium]|nr:1-deoxy-D-xylulose-5-phosphate synthase [Armatimonadota bacterium]MDW8028076.1 1-deoxy-D-xylulose-5-phosphate synthase [Armatimonadota bacterium]